MRAIILAVLAAAILTGGVQSAPVRPGYLLNPEQTCGGYPRLPIEAAKGICVGLVLGPPSEGLRPSKRVLHLPRTLLPLPGGDFLVTDLGTWDPGHGSVWRMTPRPGRTPMLKQLLKNLDLPHAAVFGPDGKIYVGEMSRIIRFDPNALDPEASIETVASGLPANKLHADRHPLSSFLFDADGALLVNVGAPSDQCAPPVDAAVRPCAEVQGDRPTAAIWRFAYLGDGRWAQTPSVFARGLRNSLALVRHASGAIYQGENSIDIDDAGFPFDEINRLKDGGDYGWPYCLETASPAPAWRGHSPLDCNGPARTRPVLLLPPHGAPLAMIYYHGVMFPQLEGRLLVSLHGYRATGSRIIAYDVDASGAPILSAKPAYAVYSRNGSPPSLHLFGQTPAAGGLIITPRWDAVKGLRPDGAPVGMVVTSDGAIWVADDRNGTILRFAKDTP
jgi:glucose/arabinose dehydrogenase